MQDLKPETYWEGRRLREERRRQLGISRVYNGPDNVVPFLEFWERRMQRPDSRPPVKPIAVK